MERSRILVLPLGVAAALSLSPPALASHNQIGCSGPAPRVTIVSDTDGHTTPYDVAGANGAPAGFDPTPLLSTTVNVGGTMPSCMTAELSVHTLTAFGIGDRQAVFEVTVDGVPMIGHTTWCVNNMGVNVPCVAFDNNSSGTTDISAHGYTLYASVAPGARRVEVRYAGCCTGLGAYSAGQLVLHHR